MRKDWAKCRGVAGFLSIDIAFALVIASFAIVLLLRIQASIAKQIHTNDITHVSEANVNLFTNIAQPKCHKTTITTKQNKSYEMCLIEGVGGQNSIIFRYYEFP